MHQHHHHSRYLVIGRKHAHVERHGTHDRWSTTAKQPNHAVLLDGADHGIHHALVVAPLVGGEGGVGLHADERQIGGGANQGAQSTRGEASRCFLPQGERLLRR